MTRRPRSKKPDPMQDHDYKHELPLRAVIAGLLPVLLLFAAFVVAAWALVSAVW